MERSGPYFILSENGTIVRQCVSYDEAVECAVAQVKRHKTQKYQIYELKAQVAYKDIK